jgi:hypothetical protein
MRQNSGNREQVPTFGNIPLMAKPANQAEAVLALARAKGILGACDLRSRSNPYAELGIT